MQTSEWQNTKLPKLQQITHLWLTELHTFFPTWSLAKREPVAHQALKDFYRFVDTSGAVHQFNLRVLINPEVVRGQFALVDIIYVFIALRRALRQSLVNCDPAEIMMIMEYLDIWQEKVVSAYTAKMRQHSRNYQSPFKRQLEQLEKLNDCVCALNTTLDTMSLLHATAQLAHVLTDADLCIVFQKEGEILFSRASAGRIGYDSKPIEMTSPYTLETVVIDEKRQDVLLEVARRNLGVSRTQALICTTIQTNDAILGRLTSVYTHPQHFTSHQVKLQEIFSKQAAQAICNAQLYENLGGQRAVQERQRIAREMHDTVFQSLATLNIKLKIALQCAEQEDWDKAIGLIEDARHLSKSAIARGRETLNNLQENCKVCEPLLNFIRPELCLFTEQSGITPNMIMVGIDSTKVPQAIGHHLQRLVGEALNNVFRHAQATIVTVHIELADGELQIEIQDNGIGFEAESVDERRSFGLIGMRGRSNLIDAELDIRSTLGRGTSVRIRAPLGCR